jgi:hypothetical protein
MKGNKHMKTITKIIYLAFALVVVTLAALTANGAPGDLFVSVNGSGSNSGGFIYQYKPTGLFTIAASGLSRPRGVAFSRFGNLFVANTTFDGVTFQASIVKITPNGVQSTVATLSGDLFGEDVAFDSSGNLFVMAGHPDFTDTIYKITPDGVQSTFGTVPGQGFGLAFDSAGNLFAADLVDATIYKFAPDGTRTIFVDASGFPPDTGPIGLAFDGFGNLFVSTGALVLKFTPDGVGSTFAMDLDNARGLAFRSSGNLFVADLTAGEILKFTPDGNQTVFASGIATPEFLAFQPR